MVIQSYMPNSVDFSQGGANVSNLSAAGTQPRAAAPVYSRTASVLSG